MLSPLLMWYAVKIPSESLQEVQRENALLKKQISGFRKLDECSSINQHIKDSDKSIPRNAPNKPKKNYAYGNSS